MDNWRGILFAFAIFLEIIWLKLIINLRAFLYSRVFFPHQIYPHHYYWQRKPMEVNRLMHAFNTAPSHSEKIALLHRLYIVLRHPLPARPY